jgi:hypothetical protein
MTTHAETLRMLREADLAGRRVRCEPFPEFDTGPADAYDLTVVAVGAADLPEATKAARTLVEALAAGGVVVTSVAQPFTVSAYAGDPLDAAYAGPVGAVAALAAEYEGLGCRTRVVPLDGVTLVVATRLTE